MLLVQADSKRKQGGGDSSDNENSTDNPMEETPESLQEESTVRKPVHTPGESYTGEKKAQKTTQDTQPQPSATEDRSTASESGLGKGTKANMKNSKKDTGARKQPAFDQNANVEPNKKQTGQTKQKGKNQQDQKQTVANDNKMVFGQQASSSKVMFTRFYGKL